MQGSSTLIFWLKHILFWTVLCTTYSRTSVARTLMARLPRLFRTRSWVLRKTSHSSRVGIFFYNFLFNIEVGILYVLIRIAWREHTTYLHVEENRGDIPTMSPDLALSATLIGSKYPCLELIFMVPKVFEQLKFDCILWWYRYIRIYTEAKCLYSTSPSLTLIFSKDNKLTPFYQEVIQIASLCNKTCHHTG